MTKPAGSSEPVLFLSPEAIYPAIGGGALRSASLFEYLAARHPVDVITFHRHAIPAAREVLTLELPPHSKHRLARATRNLRRFAAGRPPLLDRYSGFDRQIADWLAGRHYRLAAVEHFWCAPYARVLRPHADRLVLDLHNIESRLHAATAAAAPWPQSVMFRRFARAYEIHERHWLAWYDDVLVASGADASRVPAERIAVFPNTIPFREVPDAPREHAVIFTGNLEYDPNVAAVRWFAREVWPSVRRQEPQLEWRLVGRNAHAVAPYVRGIPGVRIVGEVDDAVVEIARAKVAIVPLLAGSGTRFKILEAWAAATPVISTTIGAEGLGAVPGKHLAIADDAPAFAASVVNVLRAPGDLGSNGRALYLDRYTAQSGRKLLDALWGGL
jgi:glycosyltransferase involved in cell wall biosynthesis